MNLRMIALLAGLALVAACEAPSSDGSDAGGYGSGSGAGGAGGYGSGESGELAPNVGDRVFFGYDSSVLTSEAQSTLQKQADWLQQNQEVKVVVEGHCDERGTRAYNLALGERRATAARNYLVNLGVNASRVSTVSYGKERPAVLGSTEDSWAKNRRAVTVISY
jgi:peptidoglycan-associated lipoprotein